MAEMYYYDRATFVSDVTEGFYCYQIAIFTG